ncbi:unnamed protein product [uncultured bacterium]|nr:unnamed protein product [uncultured bacterium]
MAKADVRALEVERAASDLSRLVRGWLEQQNMTWLEFVYCLQVVQDRAIEKGLEAERED